MKNVEIRLQRKKHKASALAAYILKVDRLAESVFLPQISAEKVGKLRQKISQQKCVNYTNPGFSTTNCQNKASLHIRSVYIENKAKTTKGWRGIGTVQS